MESCTQVLRRMLDERGVEWWPSDERWNEDVITHWRVGAMQWTAIEGEKGLWLNAGIADHEPLTPEQAVAATLGPTATTVDETDAMECVCDQVGRYGKRVTIHMMECSECGRTYEHVNGDYEFCPRCGRRIEVNDG